LYAQRRSDFRSNFWDKRPGWHPVAASEQVCLHYAHTPMRGRSQ
jgi:hypothetical protein